MSCMLACNCVPYSVHTIEVCRAVVTGLSYTFCPCTIVMLMRLASPAILACKAEQGDALFTPALGVDLFVLSSGPFQDCSQ